MGVRGIGVREYEKPSSVLSPRILVFPYSSQKKDHSFGTALFVGKPRLAVTSVDCLALVLLAARSCLLDEAFALLSESIAEVTTAAETHLSENFLNVRLDDHGKKGKEMK